MDRLDEGNFVYLNTRELPLNPLARRADREFGDLLDYIWKTPRFIESELKDEIEKLKNYTPQGRQLRAALELPKLIRSFPRFMGVSNMLMATSLFEHYLSELSTDIQKIYEFPLPRRGTGSRGLLQSLRPACGDVEGLLEYHLIDAALLIRNTLIHNAGSLDRSRQSERLISIIEAQSYVRKPLDGRSRGEGENSPEIRIESYGVSRRIVVPNMYAWLVTAYYRDFFVRLCAAAGGTLSVRDHQGVAQTVSA